ncbi:globin domain-containing protein [Streptomyces sp. HNM0663]|uniref:nitric oxide dioxygenase n=1 Tax=Streptomyces chengmaiensis TaxID=3040919 RepID=A0ABT6HHH3_9ACTN|nr:globin domain-containing protein [Streptomyces chengmaiensis]MDH2387504.1 globin domain-containing protein [Streptomyces chengmaiensis]
MLSETSAATVRATLPAVAASLDEITQRFYDRLFTAHPELLRELFNRGNQASGDQRRALAGSIAAFASHLVDRPDDRPDAMLARIAHKHASLGVTAEQYRTVHTHLSAAIAETLGDAVTPQVAAAWDEVYWLMADTLVSLEARLYARQGVEAGDVWRDWVVVDRAEQTADVTVFRLRPADGSPAPGFLPGQYVSVQTELPDGARQIRQYSLICAPGSDVLSIAVKRVRGERGPDGEVSAHLHTRVRAGDRLRVSAPYGDLVLDATDADTPLLLASAGIGVTPMAAMLQQLVAEGHRGPVTVVHGDRSPAAHALRADCDLLIGKLPEAVAHYWYEDPDLRERADGAATAVHTGLVDLTGIPLLPGVRAWLCGPLPFMRAVRGQLLARGVPASDVHYEVFGPDLWLGAS